MIQRLSSALIDHHRTGVALTLESLKLRNPVNGSAALYSTQGPLYRISFSMLLIEFPAEVLMGIVKSVPLVPAKELATLMLVNKVFLKLAEERLYCDLDMDLSNPHRRTLAEKCLETLKEHKSAAAAVKCIRVRWAGDVGQNLRDLFFESLECATYLSTLSLSNSPVTDICTNTDTYPPLFPETIPPNLLPSLSALNVDTLETLVQLLPRRPIRTVRLEGESIGVDSIDRLMEALSLSTKTIQHLQLKVTVPSQDHILPTFSKIVGEEKLRSLTALGLVFAWNTVQVDWGFLKVNDSSRVRSIRNLTFRFLNIEPPRQNGIRPRSASGSEGHQLGDAPEPAYGGSSDRPLDRGS